MPNTLTHYDNFCQDLNEDFPLKDIYFLDFFQDESPSNKKSKGFDHNSLQKLKHHELIALVNNSPKNFTLEEIFTDNHKKPFPSLLITAMQKKGIKGPWAVCHLIYSLSMWDDQSKIKLGLLAKNFEKGISPHTFYKWTLPQIIEAVQLNDPNLNKNQIKTLLNRAVKHDLLKKETYQGKEFFELSDLKDWMNNAVKKLDSKSLNFFMACSEKAILPNLPISQKDFKGLIIGFTATSLKRVSLDTLQQTFSVKRSFLTKELPKYVKKKNTFSKVKIIHNSEINNLKNWKNYPRLKVTKGILENGHFFHWVLQVECNTYSPKTKYPFKSLGKFFIHQFNNLLYKQDLSTHKNIYFQQIKMLIPSNPTRIFKDCANLLNKKFNYGITHIETSLIIDDLKKIYKGQLNDKYGVSSNEDFFTLLQFCDNKNITNRARCTPTIKRKINKFTPHKHYLDVESSFSSKKLGIEEKISFNRFIPNGNQETFISFRNETKINATKRLFNKKNKPTKTELLKFISILKKFDSGDASTRLSWQQDFFSIRTENEVIPLKSKRNLNACILGDTPNDLKPPLWPTMCSPTPEFWDESLELDFDTTNHQIIPTRELTTVDETTGEVISIRHSLKVCERPGPS